MNGKQLKNSILQLAIQGKLVPQDPNDEPASELLKRIRAEKEQLVKDGKLKKKDLVTTPISDEEKPFEVPEGWEWCRLGEFADIINGFTPLRTNPEFWNNGDIAWFTVDDIHEQGRIINKTKQFINKKALTKNSSRILPVDTLLLCCTASVGEYALTKIPLTTNQQFNGISVRKEYKQLVSPTYLFAIAPQFKGWLLNLAGKTTFNFVSVKKVSELIIPLPPLSEQHRIVAKIEELMPLVEEYDKAQTKLDDLNRKLPEALKKSILQEAIMGKLVAQDPNDEPASELLKRIRAEKEQLVKEKKIILSKPEKGVKKLERSEYNVPYNWTTCQLVDICRAFGRIGFRGYTKSDLVSGPKYGAISLSPSNMKESGMEYDDCTYITWEKYEESPEIIIENGDILIVKTGSSYGKTALVRNLPHEATINPQIAVIKDIKINSEYLQAFLQSPFARSKYEEFVLGTSIPTFSQLNLLSIEIPLPPLAEQHRIVAKIEQLFSQIEGMK